MGTAAEVNLHTRPHSIDRKVYSNNASSSTCTSSLPESTENKEPSTQTISRFQHNRDCDFGTGCKRRASLVAEQSGELEWKGSVGVNTRYDSRDRRISAWMGCSFRRGENGRSVVRRRTNASYQPAGVDSRSVRSQNLCSTQGKHSYLPQNGQQDSDILYQQDGGNSITSPCPHSLPAVAVVPQEGITLSAEHLPGSSNIIADRKSRLLHSSAEWMFNRGMFSWIMEALGPCQLDLFATPQPPAESVFELEARPVCNGNKCFLHQLEGQRRICLTTICPNREMPPESTRGKSNSCFSSANDGVAGVLNRKLIPFHVGFNPS